MFLLIYMCTDIKRQNDKNVSKDIQFKENIRNVWQNHENKIII